jgi:ABC-type Zn uptake system ZnuABC Zn-binding protein ZnuA
VRPGRMTAPWLATLLVVLLMAASCGEAEPEPQETGVGDDETAEPEPDPQPAPEPELHVVAKVAPIADLVAMVGGERVEVATLVPPGADSHTYEPRPSDVARLSEADAFIGVGLDLNPGAVALAEENLPEESIVLLGERYLADDALVFDHVHDEDGGHSHGEDGGHTHGDDGGHSHADEGEAHSHGHEGDDGPGPNPHVWTGLPLAADLVDGIADALGDLDPDGGPEYRERAGDARGQIEALHDRVAAATATIPEAHRTLIVYHDAWSYFARDYGLEMVTAVQPSDYAEPSAGDVREIIDLVQEHDVPALFGSEVFPSDVLDTIAQETGATYVGDLADDTLPGEPGGPDHSYLGLMRRNAELIVERLGGDTEALRD